MTKNKKRCVQANGAKMDTDNEKDCKNREKRRAIGYDVMLAVYVLYSVLAVFAVTKNQRVNHSLSTFGGPAPANRNWLCPKPLSLMQEL